MPCAPSPLPFTLVVCSGTCGIPDREAVMRRLRHAVRGCPQGVLVSTGCLGHFLHCHDDGAGLYGVVQPCTSDRRPLGTAKAIGPVTSEADADAVGDWLRLGMPNDTPLPPRLRALPRIRPDARLN